MKTASISEIKANFAAYIKATESGAVVVTRRGRPVAVLLDVRDDDELERIILSHSRKLRAILDAAHEQIRAGKASATRNSGSKWTPRRPNGPNRRRPSPRREGASRGNRDGSRSLTPASGPT